MEIEWNELFGKNEKEESPFSSNHWDELSTTDDLEANNWSTNFNDSLTNSNDSTISSNDSQEYLPESNSKESGETLIHNYEDLFKSIPNKEEDDQNFKSEIFGENETEEEQTSKKSENELSDIVKEKKAKDGYFATPISVIKLDLEKNCWNMTEKTKKDFEDILDYLQEENLIHDDFREKYKRFKYRVYFKPGNTNLVNYMLGQGLSTFQNYFPYFENRNFPEIVEILNIKNDDNWSRSIIKRLKNFNSIKFVFFKEEGFEDIYFGVYCAGFENEREHPFASLLKVSFFYSIISLRNGYLKKRIQRKKKDIKK